MSLRIITPYGLLGDVTDSNENITIGRVDPEWKAVVHHVNEGVILFLPGVTKKNLRAKKK